MLLWHALCVTYIRGRVRHLVGHKFPIEPLDPFTTIVTLSLLEQYLLAPSQLKNV